MATIKDFALLINVCLFRVGNGVVWRCYESALGLIALIGGGGRCACGLMFGQITTCADLPI